MHSKYLFILLFSILSNLVFAQKPQADVLKTEKGNIVIQPVVHGTLALQWDKKTIIIDPYGGVKAFEGLSNPDLILITDTHGDHLDLKTLSAMDLKNTKFIVPQAVADKMPEAYLKNSKILNNDEMTQIFGMDIKAVPMYNLPESTDAKHIKGRGNGYILKMADQQIYISGDTEDIPEMRRLKNIDLAFICMNLPYTMDINQAADAVLEFQPKIVYPYHYRGNPDMSDTEAFKKLVNSKNSNIEVRLRNWYPAAD